MSAYATAWSFSLVLSAINKEVVETAGDRSMKGKYQSVSEYNGSMLREIKYSKPYNNLKERVSCCFLRLD